MRNPYATAVPPRPSRVPQASALEGGSRVSVFSIEEVIEGTSLVGRRFQMLRVDQSRFSAGPRQRGEKPASPGRSSRRLSAGSGWPRNNRGPSVGQEVVLREVGEVVADDSGHYYETEGACLRPLVELVMNRQGQIFEVCRDGRAGLASGSPHSPGDNFSQQRGDPLQAQSRDDPPEAAGAAGRRPDPPSTKTVRRPSFRHSRQQVLDKMRSPLGTLPAPGPALWRWLIVYPLRVLKTLLVLLISPLRMRQWRKRLIEKSWLEQLWRVPPPRGFSYHPAVRRWAEETLGRVGYQRPGMFQEWEIFWRRQGLR